MQERLKPAKDALFARSGAVCICGIPLDLSHLAKIRVDSIGFTLITGSSLHTICFKEVFRKL
jgi:hypothetical protein